MKVKNKSWFFYNMVTSRNGNSSEDAGSLSGLSTHSLSSIGLHRVIKVLCVFLALLTYLLLYVIGNAIIAPTAVHVVIQRPKNPGLRSTPHKADGSLGGQEEIVSSSLETLFRNLNSTRCASSFKSHPPPTTSRQRPPRLPLASKPLWRPLHLSKNTTTTFLHSAFLDSRTRFGNVSYRFVRILALKQGRDTSVKYFCHFQDGEVVIEANYHEIWVSAWHPHPPKDLFHSVMIHCPVPNLVRFQQENGGLGDLEIFISQDKPCDKDFGIFLPVKNTTTEIEDDEKKEDFCVCVKPLDFPNEPRLAGRLTEWIESNLQLGASKIVIYVYSIHEDVWKVLKRYSSMLVVQVIPWALPGHLPNDPETRSQFLHAETWQRRRLEVLPYNHCLYDNLNRFHFIVPLDIDEIIFPIMPFSDWKSLLDRVLFKQHGLLDTVASFAVQNTYYFVNWDLATTTKVGDKGLSHDPHRPSRNDSYTSFLDIKFRTANFSQVGHSVKSFVNTKVARTVFNHYALSTLHPGQKFVLNLNESMVQLNHYKEDCASSRLSVTECQEVFLSSKVFDDRFAKRFGSRLLQKRKELNPG